MNTQARPRYRERRDKRGSAAARGYGARWQAERETFLKLNPLCVMCQRRGEVAAATVVDHVIPHRGNMDLFWDTTNWQALCETDHNSTKQFIEVHGYSNEVGLDGWPLDPMHPVNARGKRKDAAP